MKYRMIYIGLAAVMLLGVFTLPAFSKQEDSARYHQHQEEPGYTPCTTHDSKVFCSHLPLVLIDTKGQEIPGERINKFDRFGENTYTTAKDGTDYIQVKVSIIDNAQGNNHLTDEASFTTSSLFRIRGHASREFGKKPYLMKFIDEQRRDRDLPVMGMDAHNEWALHGPYLDKSLIRNYMWYNISGELMNYAPNVRYCEVFVNGSYRGLYVMTETITNGKEGRLDLANTYKGNTTTGYLLRIDRPTEEDLGATRDIYSYLERMNLFFEDISIRYPGKTNLTPELAEEIETDFARFEKALYSFDYDGEEYGYANWIDVDNFVDYYLINEYTRNMDAGRYSTYIYKEIGGKYRMCVWDFNNACDLVFKEEVPPEDLSQNECILFQMLFRDEKFVDRVIERYRELRGTYLSDEYLNAYIDDTLEWLGPAVARNSARWSVKEYKPLVPVERNVYSVPEAVTQLKTWLHQRGKWMDRNIDALRAVSHPSRNKGYDY